MVNNKRFSSKEIASSIKNALDFNQNKMKIIKEKSRKRIARKFSIKKCPFCIITFIKSYYKMCVAGIVNINQLDDKEFLERKLNKSYSYLKTRGPDEKGMWNDKNAFLHTRLKILDLQKTSSQPMEYGNYVLSYNGEIYNFKELKNILLKRGYKFKSSGDTEVLLASWDYWGVEALNKFDGMFAFSIWDRKTKTLYLARDRFGKKPLAFFFIRKYCCFFF